MSSDEDSLSGDDDSIFDDSDFISDFIRRDGFDEPPDLKWVFQAQSNRGAHVFKGLSSRVASDPFSLLYNPVDSYLLEKAKKEVKYLLSQGRCKVHGSDEGQFVSALDALACAMPLSFLRYLKEWIMTADDSSAASAITFDDIVGFLKGEIHMRILQISSKELRDFNKEASTLEGYEKVRKAMSKADRPAHKRPSPMGTAGLPADTFDPTMIKVIVDMNENSRALYFMVGCSDADIDDDKISNCYLCGQATDFVLVICGRYS